MPKVSVIIPSYNLGRYLGETLQSVMDQSFKDWECLIVENGSTDGSVSLVKETAARDSRFIPVLLPENKGVAVARNRGLEMAGGEYILFLDADDLIEPGYMAAAVEVLDADPSLTLVYGRAVRFGAETQWDLPPFSMETMLACNCLYISCFFRRVDAPAFDGAFKAGFEDWDFWLSLLEKTDAPAVKFLPELCFRYRTRRGSRNTGVSDDVLPEIRRRLWEKHKALYSKYFCNPVETVEYRRLKRSFDKASRWSLAWKLRLICRKVLSSPFIIRLFSCFSG